MIESSDLKLQYGLAWFGLPERACGWWASKRGLSFGFLLHKRYCYRLYCYTGLLLDRFGFMRLVSVFG